MPRKQKKYHYIYKTTNLLNDKFYIGMHSTDNLNDGYLGSGKRLKYSIAKYGVENFKIEYLEFFEDRIRLVEREKNLVNEDLIKDPMCMNLAIGGEGGFTKEQSTKGAINSNIRRRWLYLNDQTFRNKIKKYYTKNLKKTTWADNFTWVGKTHTEATKEKIREKAKLRIGEKNSQFGTYWITNRTENKKIKKEDLNNWINLGWIKGRTT